MIHLHFPTAVAAAALATLVSCASKPPAAEAPAPTTAAGPKKMTAKVYDSGFAQSHDTYNGMGVGSDGKIYYVLCSELPNVGARMYSLDPATGKTAELGRPDRSLRREGRSTPSPRARVTSTLSSPTAKLYFATHIGFYSNHRRHGEGGHSAGRDESLHGRTPAGPSTSSRVSMRTSASPRARKASSP